MHAVLLFGKKVIAGHGGASLLLNHFSKSIQISAPLYPQPQYILVEASSYTFSHVLLALLKYSTHVLLGHLPSALPAGMRKTDASFVLGKIFPLPNTKPASVLPIPLANWPTAPAVHVWDI